MKPSFQPGRNIAMKVPPDEYDRTIAFYRDLVGLRVLETRPESVGFEFGGKVLWIDRVPTLSQAEIWLQITSTEMTQAAAVMAQNKIVRCDEIEPLPPGMNAFWIKNPCGIVHLVGHPDEV